jgi:hypothetical protein
MGESPRARSARAVAVHKIGACRAWGPHASRGSEMAVASVVIPAHNEAATIGRNLRALRQGTGTDLDVVVVCNGCTDRTADEARAADPGARVIEIPQPSKVEAVRVGNAATDVFPRIHASTSTRTSSSTAPQRSG